MISLASRLFIRHSNFVDEKNRAPSQTRRRSFYFGWRFYSCIVLCFRSNGLKPIAGLERPFGAC